MTTTTAITKDAQERFWAKVSRVSTSDCWLWVAAKSTTGYGRFSLIHGTMVAAHRFAYELLVGPIPKDLQIDHLCRVRGCVNPSHLRVVTARENTLAGFGVTAQNARKTACHNGHPFDLSNTYYLPQGGRSCRACACKNAGRYRARRREHQQK